MAIVSQIMLLRRQKVNKFGQVAIVVGIMGILYLLLLVVMPVLTDIASTANVTAHVTRNASSVYPGSTSFLLASPWILWWAPGVIGMIVVVIILKRP